MKNSGAYDFPKSQLEDSIAGRFETLATDIPARLAFKYHTVELSYASLNGRANQLAHVLLAKGVETDTVVVLVEHPVHQVVAQLGVLKAGKACVPLDTSFPAARQSQILIDAQAKIIVTEQTHEARARQLATGEQRIVTVDTLDGKSHFKNPGLSIDPYALAYVLYTSGSTGAPKGVMQNHRNLLHVAMLYHRDLGIGPASRMTSPTSLTYTGTVWALLAALLNRAAFICTDFDSPLIFAQTLDQEKITTVQLITTLLRQFMQAVDQSLSLPHLRKVYTGGEALHKEDVVRFAKTFPPHCGLLYNFGSTEAGIITHHAVNLEDVRENRFLLGPEDSDFPVGCPVEDVEVILMDEGGNSVPPGEDGEIAVQSDFLSPGYWADPELTNRHFQTGPYGSTGRVFLSGDFGRVRSDGALIHRGRRDFQIKVRGYRINIAEIENALRSIDGVSGAAVTAVADTQGKSRIVAYVELEKDYELTIKELRRQLGSLMPGYMVPALILYLDQLPVAANGKLDRQALPDPGTDRPEVDNPYIEPRTATEQYLCKLWSDVLHITDIGIHDSFLELGGDSISVFRIIGQLEDDWKIDLKARVLFDTETVEALARHIGELPSQVVEE
ncbi:MAG: non-ribosomal peptide synthetase [Verrucomicrobia bacterium]|nr:non-ribosomal peptide synthetase [Verrucomicrobiota bacterium]